AARKLLADSYPQDAIPLLHQIVALARSSAWSEAHVELSIHHFCMGESEHSAEHAAQVLQGPQELVSDSARAVAGVVLCNARDMLDQPIDERLLLESAEACVRANEFYQAAIGFGLLGECRASLDREEARGLLERAVRLYDDAGSMVGGPGKLRSLARLALEEGNLQEARAYLDRGLGHLAKFPLGGRVVRHLEQQLV